MNLSKAAILAIALATAAPAYADIISISPSTFNESNVLAMNSQQAATVFGTFNGGQIAFTGTNTSNNILSTQTNGQARFQGDFTGQGQATFDLTNLIFGSTTGAMFSSVEFRLQGLVGNALISVLDNEGTTFFFNTSALGATGADRFAFQAINNQSIARVGISAAGGFDDLRQLRLGAAAVVTAVPEPATWAMLIFGFGLVGGAMRRRTTTLSYA